MTTSLADNPAVTNPRKSLSKPQQVALGAIKFYRHQRVMASGTVEIGTKRFSSAVMLGLATHGLITMRGHEIVLTQAGQVALAKLQGPPHASA